MSAVAKMIGGLLLAVILASAASFSVGGAKAPSAPAELAITVNENFVFLPLRLHCKAGVPVRCSITHRAPSSGPDIIHSVVLLNRGTNTDEYGQAVLNAHAEDNYVPAAFRSRVLATTTLIHAGGKAELNFTAPTEAGEYPLVCSFPGHCLLGMKATLIVD
jgi:azurin